MTTTYAYGISCRKCGATRFIEVRQRLSREQIDAIEMQQGYCVLCGLKEELQKISDLGS